MWKQLAAATMACSAILFAVAVPAKAERITIADESGDTIEPGLDITSFTVDNRDRAVVIDFTFRSDRRGEVIVNLDLRHRAGGAKVVSQHPRRGPDNLIFFADGDDSSPARCRGLSYDWDRPAASLRLRVPARCMAGGNYGAVRVWALIEGFRSTSDVDYAPETPDGDLQFTRWMARG